MATSDAPLNVPNVTLAVARGASAALSGGTSALSFSIAELSRDAEVTVSTDGTYDFGSVGPELVVIFDPEKTDESGKIIPIFGPNTSVAFSGDGEGNFVVESVADMDGGLGWPTSDGSRYRLNVVAHNRGFESRTYHWPESHQNNASATDFTAWQVKPCWNMANFKGSGVDRDTNFFMVTWQRFSAGTDAWKNDSVAVSNSPGLSAGVAGRVAVRNTTSPGKMPLFEPYTTDFMYDQVDTNQTGQAFFEVETFSPIEGQHYIKAVKTGITLHEPDGASKTVNSMSYPAYVTGFPVDANNIYTYEGFFYKTAGAGAACRVMICDTPLYENRSKQALMEPVSWGSTEAKVKLRGGPWALNDLSGKYICVVGSNNQQIGSGVQI